jgi:hypothetical protein
MENQLVKIINDSGLEKSKAEILLSNFQNYFEIAAEWDKKIDSLVVTKVTQVAEMKMAREARLFLKQKRLDVENTRKQLKEQSLREGQTIDSIARVLKNLIEPIEEKASQIERFAEIQEENQRLVRLQERTERLIPYTEGMDLSFYDFKNMPDADFEVLFNGFKTEYEAQKEAERKAREERIAAEKARIEEEKRIREENERLRKETEAKQKEIERQQKEAEVERRKQSVILEKQKAEAEARQKAIEEAARKEREKYQVERKKLEAELQVKKDAEETARKESEAMAEKERKAKEQAEKAPDKEKLSAWVNSFSIDECPVISRKLTPTSQVIEAKFKAFKIWSLQQIEQL